MSMTVLTIIQLAGILLAYCFVSLILPWLLLRKKFQRFTVPEQIMGYYLAGQFYIIYLVFLLQFLHISYRPTLIIGTFAPFIIVFIIKYRGHFAEICEGILIFVKRVIKGELGVRTVLAFCRKYTLRNLFKRRKRKLWRYFPDMLMTLLVILGVVYLYGNNIITVLGYKASDLPVHNYWVNMMCDNNVFGAGVYPYGFHCVIYYLHAVFGIPVYVLFRLFSFVEVLFVVLALLISLRAMCKTMFAPYIGAGIFLAANVFTYNSYFRFTATLPQEYGMIFIFPAAYFAIKFFSDYAEVLKIKEPEEQKKRERQNRWYLAGFAISFSLTLTVHFYATMPAGYFCAGIAAGFFFRFFRWKYFKRIMLTGIISVLLAVLPMAIGVATGHELQGSLYWALGIITGTDDEEETTSEDDLETTDSASEESTVEEGTTDGTEAANTTEEVDVTDLQQESSDNVVTEETEQISLTEKIKTILTDTIITVRNNISSYVFDNHEKAANIVFAGIIFTILCGGGFMLVRKTDYAALIWSVGIYMMIMAIMESAAEIGIPELMDKTRNAIFLAYSFCLLCAVCVDAVIYFFLGWAKKRWFLNIASLVALAGIGCYMLENNLVRDQPIENSNEFESNEEITCITNILAEGKDSDDTWTIVSANDALRMIEEYGYHYEMITFLQKLTDLSGNTELTIPTDTIYFFIEKIPINYAGSYIGYEPKEVSVEGAEMSVSYDSGLTPYKGELRWSTMSHMYYWAQAFMELYPNEMEVYYETDAFVCYRLRQNEYSLYNLVIDYGYNQ